MGPGGALHKPGISGSRVNERTVSFTVGIPGATNVTYNFTSLADMFEQSVQLGTSIIPANSPVVSIVAKCTEGLNGAATGICDVGKTAGSDEYISAVDLDDTDEIISVSAQVIASAAATAIYFSITPDVNWNTLITGKWKIWITYNDNSTN